MDRTAIDRRTSSRWVLGRGLLIGMLMPLQVWSAPPPVPVGGQFQVNTYWTSRQETPAVAAAADGSFVVVWMSNGSSGGDSSSFSIQGQRFSPGGTPLGAQFQVNSATTDSQLQPAVAADAAGNFAVVWSSGSPAGWAIAGQRYAASGSPAGSEFVVSSFDPLYQEWPAVAAAADGDFVVAWARQSASGSDPLWSVQAQRFAAGGTPAGPTFQVNTATTSFQRRPAITADPEGDFVVAWQSYAMAGNDTSAYSVQARRYTAAGAALGGEFQVNTYTDSFQDTAAIAADADGNFVVAWGSFGSSAGDNSETSVHAQRFSAAGVAQGSQFQVNDYTTNYQWLPAVAVDAEGDFVVVWQSLGASSGDTAGYSLHGRRYSAAGTSLGGPFQINSYTTGDQTASAIAVDAQGDFVVVWKSIGSVGGDNHLGSIQGQRFRVTGDLQGKVWVDQDVDGIQDGAEPGLAGVTVELYDDALSLRRTTATDVDGNYFLKAKEGSWHLRFLPPSASFTFTAQDVGGDDTVDSDADPASGETDPFTVATNVLDSSIDAGLVLGVSTLAGEIWDDLDRDGVREGGEPGLGGVAVNLLDGAGLTLLASQPTNGAGGYSFGGLLTAAYVVEVAPEGPVAYSPQDAGGDDTVDSDVDPASGRTAPIDFIVGSQVVDVDAGLRFLTLFVDGFGSGDTAAWSVVAP
jgi:hypothetical protein